MGIRAAASCGRKASGASRTAAAAWTRLSRQRAARTRRRPADRVTLTSGDSGTRARYRPGVVPPVAAADGEGSDLMIGMVLAAGAGRRLRPYTDTLPKALVPVDGETTILDIALGNLAEVGLTDVVIVVGYRAGAVEERQAALEERYGVSITLVHNDKAEDWNNAYSMWLAREFFKEGVLMVNGDTVHPVSVERTLLGNRGPDVLLAVDDVKKLAEEEMKVILDGDGHLQRITKLMDPATANGEYI